MRMRLMNVWLLIAAINGFLAVAAGAFGAHGLQGRLDAHGLQVFETGARYQMYHALAMGLAALAMRGAGAGAAQAAAAFFLAGIVLFSGSLYILALSGYLNAKNLLTQNNITRLQIINQINYWNR